VTLYQTPDTRSLDFFEAPLAVEPRKGCRAWDFAGAIDCPIPTSPSASLSVRRCAGRMLHQSA